MPDVNIGYEGVSNASAQLRMGRLDMIERLQNLQTMIDNLVGSEFRTQLASGRFMESYTQWNTGAKNVVEGLEGMARYLSDVVREHQELDARLAGGADT